jgi:UDP-glucose 4-epimerase
MENYTDQLKGKKVIVTGGLGFVGQNLCKKLITDFDCEITIVDDCSNSSETILESFSKKVNFKKMSVLDTDALFPLIDQTHYIFHLACKQISASGLSPVDDLKINALSTLQILDYIKNNPLKNIERFVYSSSCSIYGSSNIIPTSELGSINIKSNYAATKLLGENYTNIYNANYKIPTAVVRYSNVYGVGQTPQNPYCGVIGKFISNALKGVPLQVFGDGEQTRDYTYIDDAINATIIAATHPKALGEFFNVGTSTEVSVNQIIELIKENVPTLSVDYLEERDIDNIRRRSIDIEKIQQKLGWSPRINIKKGIQETIRWYQTSN